MSELTILVCRRCGSTWFPDRLWCAVCGGRDFERVAAGVGVVEEETELHRPPGPVRLGSVRLDAGPVVIARLGEGIVAGGRVRLDEDGDAAVWARPARTTQQED
jgi:uncharacterized OB-fold protein